MPHAISQDQTAVVTRFAPSPTGYLHIGGARTALFNWLYARHTGGKFLLRIEDTDTQRSSKEAVDAIFKGLDWLGLQSDEAPIYQSKRQARHVEVINALLESGKAYRCFMTPDEIEAERTKAMSSGFGMRSIWRDREPNSAQINTPHVIRFKGPLNETLVVPDIVQGEVQFQSHIFDDLILLRSDGSPTYNLAVVADDHDMAITHIIRGDDHLNNAARQSLIYKALGWTIPKMAHIPLIHGPDGAKLSKRHGAQAVGDYESMGYLPEAMTNYLSRLGWSHGDHEIFDIKSAIEWFDIININKAPARLDFNKLSHVNAHWIRQATPERLFSLSLEAYERLGQTLTEAQSQTLFRTLPHIIERAQTINAIPDLCAFAVDLRENAIDDKTRGLLTPETTIILKKLKDHIEIIDDWSLETLDQTLKSFLTEQGLGMGKIGPVLRGIMCLGHPGPDIIRIFVCLGREVTVSRLNNSLFI